MSEDVKVIKYVADGKLFLRAFLIDSTLNFNDWKVTAASIPRNIRSFIGMPLVLDSNYDHPKWVDALGLIGNFENQQRFSIGTIIDVVQKGGRYDAIIEITNPAAKDAIQNNDIPLFVSPRIVYPKTEPDDAIANWVGFHEAIVDKPAYGSKAKIDSLCYGDVSECHLALKSAKKEDCGFCVKTALLKLAGITENPMIVSTSTDGSVNVSAWPYTVSTATQTVLVSKDSSSHNTSQFTDNENSQTEMGDNPQLDSSKFISREDYEKEKKALDAQIDALKSVAEQAQKAADAKIAAIEEQNRVDKIKVVVNSKVSDAKKADEMVKSFTESKLAPEKVSELLAYIPTPEQKPLDNSEQFTANIRDGKVASAKWFDAQRSYERSLIK